MDASRIFLGGLIAGVIITLGEGLRSVILSAQISTSMPLVVFVIRSLTLGFGCVLLYAATLPRFGRGVKSAAQCGIIVFLIGAAFPPFGMTTSAFPAPREVLVAMIWNAVVIPLATIAGAWAYREKESSIVRRIAGP
jgi:hypothetical protein